MNPDSPRDGKVPNLSKMTKTELNALVNSYMREHGPPKESYDGDKNTLYGWTDDGNGVWVLPASKPNLDWFGEVAKSHPDLGQCELMRLAGAEFFADWKDSDRARAAKSHGQKVEEMPEQVEGTQAGDSAVPT